jgi:hypothetical protein
MIPTGFAQLLETRRHVHPVAEQVLALDHHVAEIDADSEDDPSLRRDPGLPDGDAALHRNRARNGVHDRAELGDGAVAHELDDPAVMPAQQRLDHLAAKVAERRERASLVRLNKARVTDHIGGHNCRQPPLCPGRRHDMPLQRQGRPRAAVRSGSLAADASLFRPRRYGRDR